MTFLIAQNLTKKIKTADAILNILDDISLTVPKSTSLAIVGPSGAGKSTLLGLLAGLDTPDSGSVILDGVDLFLLNEEQRAAQRAGKIGFVFQNFLLLPKLTALENVRLPLTLFNLPNAHQRALEALDRVGLAHRTAQFPHQLSGGEQQRVALARAFAPNPEMLFADEPTANLDEENGHKIIDSLFQRQREDQTTLVLITHDKMLAERCDATLTLSHGKVV